MKISNKRFLTLLILVASFVWLTAFSFPDNKLHVVFCDVGQGDATLISLGLNQILIDGGPNDKVLDCLAKNMPFFDKTVEVVAMTHPEADHMTGLISVLEKYKVNFFLSGPEGNSSSGYQALTSNLNSHKEIKIINPYAGTKIKLGNVNLDSLWPTREWAAENIDSSVILSETKDLPGNGAILGVKATDSHLNDFSLVFLLTYNNKLQQSKLCSTPPEAGKFVSQPSACRNNKVLLMGDADSRVDDKILLNSISLPIDILKFPHHGSKTGMTKEFLEEIMPKEAVISVGKNSYGHPTSEALDMLKSLNVKIRRTDLEGDIKYTFN